MLAQVLAGDKRIALIDTEGGTSEMYADRFDFDIEKIAEHSPDKFIAVIRQIVDSGAYGAIILDSFSHAWAGNKGVLEIAGGKYTGWRSGTNAQNKLYTAVRDLPIHLIVTMRLKKVYDIQEVDGRQVITQAGVKPVQRSDAPYEFDWVGQIDQDSHRLFIVGARDERIENKVYEPNTVDLAHDLLEVLSDAPRAIARYNPVKELEPGYVQETTRTK